MPEGQGRSGSNLTVWDFFVDLATIVWVGLFFAGIASPGLVPSGVQLALLAIFVADLVVKSRRAPNLRTFLRRHWSDILMAIPYFRIFRVLRLLRVLRILRAARIARVGRFPGLKALESFRRKSMRVARRVREQALMRIKTEALLFNTRRKRTA